MRIVRKRRKHNPALDQATRQKIERREARIKRMEFVMKADYRREILIQAVRDDITAIIKTAEKIHEEKRAREVAAIHAKHAKKAVLWDRRTKEYKRMVARRESGVDLQAIASVAPVLEQTNADPALAAVRASIRADAVAAGVDARELAP
jgi:hypothetical protein